MINNAKIRKDYNFKQYRKIRFLLDSGDGASVELVS